MTACAACDGPARCIGRVGVYGLWRCARCATEFLDPQPDNATLERIYGQHYYDAWGLGVAEAVVASLKRRTFAHRLAQAQPWLTPGGRILDVGCATGYLLEVAREMGYVPFGVELSAFGAAVCREKFGAGRVHAGTLETATFDENPGGEVDAIFMSDLIEHVRDPVQTVVSAAARLAPKGCLVITTPWAGGRLHRTMRRHWLHYKIEHLWYFSPAGLECILRRAGFGGFRRLDAYKTLSLRYAAHQGRYYGAAGRTLATLLRWLPDAVADYPLRLQLGEFTLLALRQ